MRAALEQVKQELGADALVLETREIRAGGFLGIGSRPLIELRVAVNEPPATMESGRTRQPSRRAAEGDFADEMKTVTRRTSASSKATGKTLSAFSAQAKGQTPAFAAMAARAYANESARQDEETDGTQHGNSPAQKVMPADVGLNGDEDSSGIELADTPPRIVHKPSPKALRTPVAPASEPEPERMRIKIAAAEPAPEPDEWPVESARTTEALLGSRELFGGDLARLRAEMRTEMSAIAFSMNALVARQVTHRDSSDGHDSEARATFEADPEIFDSPFYEIYSVLIAAGLRPELARGAVRAGLQNSTRQVRDAATIARAGLVATLPSILRFADDPLAAAPGSDSAPLAIALIGPTGVGKTTTIAKLAARVVCRLRRRVELITFDTWRIAATEQLRIYAEIIGAGCHVAHSVGDLDALVRRFAGVATVLIDTAGRSPADLTDELELGNYLREYDDLLKLMVMPATTHQIDAHAAFRQFALYGPDQLILTKLDETTRPGAAVSVAGDSPLPLTYLSSGQRVPEDLERATPLTLALRVVRASFASQDARAN